MQNPKQNSNPIQALWHDNARESSLHPVEFIPKGCVPVTSLFSMVSTGTERLVASGSLDSDFAANMSVQHQEGDFGLPIKYGYSLVGRTTDYELVHLMHPHQSVAFAEPSQLFVLPKTLTPEAGTLISNMETVVNAIWDSQLFYTEQECRKLKIAVVGFGNIGALLAITLRKVLGASPVVVEQEKWRTEQAKNLGFEIPDDSQPFDLIFHSTGSETGLKWCLGNSAMDGVIVDLSWYGAKPVALELGREFHYRRLRLISSQVSQIPRHKPQENYLTRKQYCAELLQDPIYLQLISDKIPFAKAPDFYTKLRTNQLPMGLIWLLDYAGEKPPSNITAFSEQKYSGETNV